MAVSQVEAMAETPEVKNSPKGKDILAHKNGKLFVIFGNRIRKASMTSINFTSVIAVEGIGGFAVYPVSQLSDTDRQEVDVYEKHHNPTEYLRRY